MMSSGSPRSGLVAPGPSRVLRALVTGGLVTALALSPLGCRRPNKGAAEQDNESAEQVQRASPPATQTPRSAQPSELLPPDRTYAVISGVLSWPDPGLGAFSPVARKDQALADLLRARGVPAEHIKLLLDAQATAGAITEAVVQTAQQAPPGSTLLFYYAGHGVRGKDGQAYFASRDMVAARPAATGLSLSRLTAAIGDHFKGERVVLMADCCYSGALKGVAERLSNKGLSAVSLTSADAANVSTNNWTFTQAVIDGLSGDPLCDEDGDGAITLKELSSEVRDAMLYREGQRHGFHRGKVGPETLVALVQGGTEKARELPPNRRRYVITDTPRGSQVARVRAVGDGELKVRTFDYSTSTDHQIAAGEARPIEFRRYPVGAAIKVYWGGKVWPARVTAAEGDFHFITYPGWPAHWDEWVTSRRIVGDEPIAATVPKGSAVTVEWRGEWYPARVLQRQGDRTLIHYDGYDASWDEWVGPRRLRQR
jgi:hypothetical protein